MTDKLPKYLVFKADETVDGRDSFMDTNLREVEGCVVLRYQDILTPAALWEYSSQARTLYEVMIELFCGGR